MRIIVVSDTHMNFQALHSLIKEQRPRTDLFLHLGDGEQEIGALLALYPDLPLRAVCGNCDPSGRAPEHDVVDAQGVRIFMTHGHQRQVKQSLEPLMTAARGLGARIALYGHTHCQYYGYLDGLHVMNPGSLCMPRGSRAGYGVIEIQNGQILCALAHAKAAPGI